MGATSSIVTGTLNLRRKGLSYEIFEQHMGIVGDKALSRVKELILCRNQLSALPPRMKVMVSLVEIRCTDNWLKWLPDELRLLSKLESLVVGGNQLASIDALIPPEIRILKKPATEESGEAEPFTKIGPWKTLRTLRLGQNRVNKLPLNFGQLFINLKTLVANKNGIASLPPDLFDLPMLELLVLSNNELMTLPPVSNTKIRLRCLVLSKNKFTEIPSVIGKMNWLQKLYFNFNEIETLPKLLGSLRYLYRFDISNNKLTGDTVLASGLLKSATLHDITIKPGNPNVPKDLSSRELFAASPLASPMRRMDRGLDSPMQSHGAKAGEEDDSDYEDPSPRREGAADSHEDAHSSASTEKDKKFAMKH